MPHPKISVITPVYNAARTLEMCIQSVVRQNYPEIEHIIMDGNSTDDTVALVRKLQKQQKHIRLFSEQDTGIYDAMNKGMDHSTGEWLYFLGADDLMYNDTVLLDLAHNGVFQPKRVVYGNVYVDGHTSWAADKTVYDGPFSLERLLRKNICHQSMFYPRSVIQTIGYFNTKYHTTADWDYNIRCFSIYDFYYIDKIIAIFRAGGKSSDKTDDSIWEDLPGNLISYFNIDPWSEEQYDINSPFYYHMSRFREHTFEQKINKLIHPGADRENDAARRQNTPYSKTVDSPQASVHSPGTDQDSSEKEINELRALIEEKNKRIETILNSYTWRTGNIILAPLKYLARVFIKIIS